MSYANNKGADQPAQLRSLISAFVVHCLDSVMPLVSKPEISEQAGFSLTWSETPEDTFSHDEAHVYLFPLCIHPCIIFTAQLKLSVSFRVWLNVPYSL